MLVKWNGKNVWSISTGIADGSVVQLVPGPNEIKKELWETVSKHPVVKARMEKDVICEKTTKVVKMLEVVGVKTDDSKGSDDNSGDDQGSGDSSLSSLNATEAVKLIKETHNVELLREWKEEETRKKPLAAIEAQLKEIEDDRNNEGSGEE